MATWLNDVGQGGDAMTAATLQKVIVMAMVTLCGAVLLAFVGLIVYAILRDGEAAQGIITILQNAVDIGLGGITTVLGIHTVVAGGLIPTRAPTAPAAPLPPSTLQPPIPAGS